MIRATPFKIALCGVLADYLTTRIGLGMGFYETHPSYSPLLAAAIFFMALAVLTSLSVKRRVWDISVCCLASAPFLGAVNNLLVIAGVFPGLVL